jgi:hypothetical protein
LREEREGEKGGHVEERGGEKTVPSESLDTRSGRQTLEEKPEELKEDDRKARPSEDVTGGSLDMQEREQERPAEEFKPPEFREDYDLPEVASGRFPPREDKPDQPSEGKPSAETQSKENSQGHPPDLSGQQSADLVPEDAAKVLEQVLPSDELDEVERAYIKEQEQAQAKKLQESSDTQQQPEGRTVKRDLGPGVISEAQVKSTTEGGPGSESQHQEHAAKDKPLFSDIVKRVMETSSKVPEEQASDSSGKEKESPVRGKKDAEDNIAGQEPLQKGTLPLCSYELDS